MTYIEYFQNKKGFKRFFDQVKDKYNRAGKITGYICIKNITNEETLAFTDFFGRKYEKEMNVKLSIKEFLKILSFGQYADFDFIEYLKATYVEFDLETNKEKRIQKQTQYQKYFETIIKNLNNVKLQQVLIDNIYNSSTLGKILKRKYNLDKNNLQKELEQIDKLLMNISKEATYLPIYASKVSNPHFLDFQTSTGTFFFHILSVILNEPYPDTNETKNLMLQKINVFSDPISNFVITYNLIGNDVLDSFYQNYGTICLNLENILKLSNISGKKNKIYIFENPSILNYIKSIDLDISVIITSGVPNQAFHQLISKISVEEELYYNGDFDPEGLLIADKLEKKYGNLKLICYEKQDYLNCHPTKIIGNNSLHKLTNINNLNLLNVKDCLLETKKAGYQENNLNRLIEFINKNQ